MTKCDQGKLGELGKLGKQCRDVTGYVWKMGEMLAVGVISALRQFCCLVIKT